MLRFGISLGGDELVSSAQPCHDHALHWGLLDFGQFHGTFPKAAHWVGVVFMAAGGLPLLMFVQSLQQRSIKVWNDAQVKGFILFLLLVSFSLAYWLYSSREIALLTPCGSRVSTWFPWSLPQAMA